MATRKIDMMHREFGRCTGHTCRECRNLLKFYVHGRTIAVCKVYGADGTVKTHWMQWYQACGMLNRPWGGKSLLQLLHTQPKSEDPGPSPEQLRIGI